METGLKVYILFDSYDLENTNSSNRDQCIACIRGWHGYNLQETDRFYI